MRKHTLLAISLTLIFLLVFSGCAQTQSQPTAATFTPPKEYAVALTVTINPEIKLYLDNENKILATEFLNEDAKTAYSDLNLNGLTLDSGISKIVATAIDKKYLKSGADVTVEVTKINDETVTAEKLLDSSKEAVSKTLKEKSFSANVVTKTADSVNAASSKEAVLQASSSSVSASSSKAASQKPEETVKECKTCGGSGECPYCHGGKDPCPACKGTGYETCPMCDKNGLDHGETCHTCGGSHKYLCTHCKGKKTAVDCPSCGGMLKCPDCKGSGTQK